MGDVVAIRRHWPGVGASASPGEALRDWIEDFFEPLEPPTEEELHRLLDLQASGAYAVMAYDASFWCLTTAERAFRWKQLERRMQAEGIGLS